MAHIKTTVVSQERLLHHISEERVVPILKWMKVPFPKFMTSVCMRIRSMGIEAFPRHSMSDTIFILGVDGINLGYIHAVSVLHVTLN